MSKFAEQIKAKQLQRVALQEPIRALSVETNIKEIVESEAYQYNIGVVLSMRVQCHSDDLPYVETKARRAMIQEVFGEFRDSIVRVHEALFDRDYMEATKALSLLELQMFGD